VATAGIPGDIMTKCATCRALLYTKDFLRDMRVCSKCGAHSRLGAWERLEMTVDEGSFEETEADLEPADPDHFPDYPHFPHSGFPDYLDKVAQDQQKTKLREAILTGTATIENHPTVIGIMDFGFRGGSMSSVVGEKVARAFELALERSLPAIMFSTSGGARMQEGIFSLMQMPKTSAAAGRLHRAGLPYVVVLCDPSTAGVQASFASLADITLAEPGAIIGFTGARVIEQTLKIRLPKDFQSSEFQLKHGMIDLIVPRRQIRETLGQLLEWFTG
jgi:acetyl-CoA carboxylase carboxyl transferase subunit beta